MSLEDDLHLENPLELVFEMMTGKQIKARKWQVFKRTNRFSINSQTVCQNRLKLSQSPFCQKVGLDLQNLRVENPPA